MLRDLFSLFPAYAGVILRKLPEVVDSMAFPRIRGGDPETGEAASDMADFSPHTRG